MIDNLAINSLKLNTAALFRSFFEGPVMRSVVLGSSCSVVLSCKGIAVHKFCIGKLIGSTDGSGTKIESCVNMSKVVYETARVDDLWFAYIGRIVSYAYVTKAYLFLIVQIMQS